MEEPDPIHGTTLHIGEKGKKSGAENAERAAMQSELKFFEICTQLQAAYEDLDSWFVAWGAWVIDEDAGTSTRPTLPCHAI